jgi:plasmid stabilization system protein ParE
MIRQVISRPSVRTDLQNAIQYYKKVSPKLANHFLTRIKEAKNHLSEFPEAYEIRYLNVRIKPIKQFPFNIHYIIDGNVIVILAIIHAYKRPTSYL